MAKVKAKKEVKEKKVKADKNVCVVCSHSKDIHYGGHHEWCNTQDCKCQAFQGNN